jgi:phospholipid transport system substrate-binding protein
MLKSSMVLCLMAPMAQAAPVAQAPQAAQAPATVPASVADAAAAQKSVRALINAIRYNKDDLAAKKLNFDGMARLLLADDYAQASTAQRQDFVASLGKLVTGTSFPKGRDLFHYLDALLFETATSQGDAMHVKSVVVVHRNLKKVELPIEWVLTRTAGQWQVVDIISMNESTAQGIREEEVLPLYKEGGLTQVLTAMHERLEQLKTTETAAP